MSYWDSSALVPLLHDEGSSETRARELRSCSSIETWWGSRVECASALARLWREGDVDDAGLAAALARLEELAEQWAEVTPSDRVRRAAVRLIRVHPLRAADALQLAAAVAVTRGDPAGYRFHCADGKLAAAAEREGFTVAR